MTAADAVPAPEPPALPGPSEVRRPVPTATWYVDQPPRYNSAGGIDRDRIFVQVSRHTGDGRVIRIKQRDSEVRIHGVQLEELARAYAAALAWGGDQVDDGGSRG